jgi:hypothetical protein
MDERVARLDTPDEAEQFALNVEEDYPDLALAARRRGVELRAAAYGAKSQVELEAIQAVYAYERARWQERGKKVRASRTWQMIERHGIIGAVERAVDRKDTTDGYRTLFAMGMQDF